MNIIWQQLQAMSICIHFSFQIIYKEMIWWISFNNSCNQCQYVFIFHFKLFIKKWFDEYQLTTVATNVNMYSFSFQIIHKEIIWWISVDNSCNRWQNIFIFIWNHFIKKWFDEYQLQPMSICIHFHFKLFIKKWFDEYQLTTVATDDKIYSFLFEIIS